MKILFVSDLASHAWGGSEELWALTAMRMAQQGHDVSAAMVARDKPVARVEQLVASGVKLEYLPKPGLQPLAKRLRGRVQRMLNRHPYRVILRKTKPDLVVHSFPFQTNGFYEVEMTREENLPYVIVLQAVFSGLGILDDICDRLVPVYSGARACCFVSHANHRELETMLGVRLPNARVVRNPYNVPYDAAPPWPSENDGYRLACVGRLEPYAKGQDLLVQLMAMPKWRERRLSVSLYGKGFSERALKRLVEMHGVGDRITFVGHTDDVTKIWASHHAMVLPSRFEGLPLAEVEAMLCGRTCVTTNVSGNPELLEEGVTGFIAAGPTVGQLDEAMERAWNRRSEWRRMGEEAGRSIRKQVSRDVIGEFAEVITSSR